MQHHYAYDEEERSGEEYADEYDSAFDHFTREYAPMSPFDTAEDEFGCVQEESCEDAAAGAKDSSLNFAGDEEKVQCYHGNIAQPYQRAEEYLVSLLEELSFYGFLQKSEQKCEKSLTNFCEYFEFGAVRRCANLVDLAKC